MTVVESRDNNLLSFAGHTGRNFRMRRRYHNHRDADRECEFFLEHAREVAEAFKMFFADRCDHRDVGCDDRTQPRDFARGVGAGFDDGDIGVVGQREQRQWHANFVVQIADRCVHVVSAGEHGREHSLRTGLAVRPADGNDRFRPGVSPVVRERAERLARVAHDVHGHTRICGARRTAYDERSGAGSDGVAEKVVRIKPVADERHEQRPSGDRARVGADCDKLARAGR